MRSVELAFPAENPEIEFASLLSVLGLVLSAPVELKSYPGSQHWHVQHPELNGTLELTWWPQKERFWIKVARNRDGEWIGQATEVIAVHFQNR